MNTEPVYTIGGIVTSLKVAVVAVITAVALGAQWSAEMTAATIGAASAIVILVGDILGYVLTRPRVTPVAAPVLPIDTAVNTTSADLPDAVVVAK